MSVIQAPISYRERSSGIPRRKSCRACAKAKRRCDLLLPVCSRCTQRGLNCEYPLLEASRLLFSLDSMPEYNNGLIFSSSTAAALVDQPPPPIPMPIMPVSVQKTRGACGNSPSSQLSIEPLFTCGMSRLQFTLGVFQNAHRAMVLENQTPWCHPLLYQNGMPRVMQDAYACCSLYMNRNSTNSRTILSIIENRVGELQALAQPSDALECLARLQALILYQTIRIFDNDASALAAAGSTMPALQATLTHFLQTVSLGDALLTLNHQSLDSLIEDSTNSGRKDYWLSWIFEESVRRTQFLSLLLITIWNVLQYLNTEQKISSNVEKPTCDGKLGLSGCGWYWYLSAHLWEATTRYEFAVAYAEKNRFIINNLDFSEFLASGQPEDVDQLGRMALSAIMGNEALQDWILTRITDQMITGDSNMMG